MYSRRRIIMIMMYSITVKYFSSIVCTKEVNLRYVRAKYVRSPTDESTLALVPSKLHTGMH